MLEKDERKVFFSFRGVLGDAWGLNQVPCMVRLHVSKFEIEYPLDSGSREYKKYKIRDIDEIKCTLSVKESGWLFFKSKSVFLSFFCNSTKLFPEILISEQNVDECKAEIDNAFLYLKEKQLIEREKERLATEEAERLARIEKERLAAEEAEQLARIEKERLAAEEAEQLARVEEERLETEEAERLEAIERDRLEKEEWIRLQNDKRQNLICAIRFEIIKLKEKREIEIENKRRLISALILGINSLKKKREVQISEKQKIHEKYERLRLEREQRQREKAEQERIEKEEERLKKEKTKSSIMHALNELDKARPIEKSEKYKIEFIVDLLIYDYLKGFIGDAAPLNCAIGGNNTSEIFEKFDRCLKVLAPFYPYLLTNCIENNEVTIHHNLLKKSKIIKGYSDEIKKKALLQFENWDELWLCRILSVKLAP